MLGQSVGPRTVFFLLLLSYCFWMLGCQMKPRQEDGAMVADPHNPVIIRVLIEKLAIAQHEALDDPIFTPSQDTPASDPRVIAYDAAKQLRGFGIEAFPFLLDSLDDRRQSVAFRRVLPSTVGDACYSLIAEQVYSLPPGYPASFYRRGADGQWHERPASAYDLLTPTNVREWLTTREGRTLPELQLEALGWVLAEEEHIGAATRKDAKRYLAPLRARYAQLKAAVGAWQIAQGVWHE